ncbi:MAG: hypothetical protein JW982_00030 [Spirochaetes bacterium]|nr:hypothetical protein [Spirochaetota bacterium]
MVRIGNKSAQFVFLKSYFKLFNASIKSIELNENEISGVIEWNEDHEMQEFVWNSFNIYTDYSDVSSVNNFLASNKLMKGDRICTSIDSIIENMASSGWDVERTLTALKILRDVKIAMIDKMEITDYFYVRF